MNDLRASTRENREGLSAAPSRRAWARSAAESAAACVTLCPKGGRLRPADDQTEVTAAQVCDVVERLISAGQWREGDPAILVVFDAGYDTARLSWLLKDLPVEVLGRLRSDRVLCFPAPPRRPGRGRPARHGSQFKLAGQQTWPAPAVTTLTQTARYGTAAAIAEDLRLPWERPAPAGRLTPARVRRGFRNIRATMTCPAGAPKPGKPGPGRPPGSTNRHPAARHGVGKHGKTNPGRKIKG
jgi:hypothetical protein